MKKNTKILLGVGAALAAVGAVAYAATAAAKPSGGGTQPAPTPAPPTPAPPGVNTVTFAPGHRYSITVVLPASYAQTAPLPQPPALFAPILAAIGNASNAQFTQSSPTTYVATFDYTGPQQAVQVPVPIGGAAVQVKDLGGAIGYHPVHLAPSPAPSGQRRLFVPGA
jgi:hypothetical protein